MTQADVFAFAVDIPVDGAPPPFAFVCCSLSLGAELHTIKQPCTSTGVCANPMATPRPSLPSPSRLIQSLARLLAAIGALCAHTAACGQRHHVRHSPQQPVCCCLCAAHETTSPHPALPPTRRDRTGPCQSRARGPSPQARRDGEPLSSRHQHRLHQPSQRGRFRPSALDLHLTRRTTQHAATLFFSLVRPSTPQAELASVHRRIHREQNSALAPSPPNPAQGLEL